MRTTVQPVIFYPKFMSFQSFSIATTLKQRYQKSMKVAFMTGNVKQLYFSARFVLDNYKMLLLFQMPRFLCFSSARISLEPDIF